MIFISIIITLVLDRIFNQLHSFRRFKWLQDYNDWMEDVLSIKRLPAWVGLAVLILPLIFAVSLLQGMVADELWGLFDLALYIVILFLCLGPLDTEQQIDDYLHSIDTGEQQKRHDIASTIFDKEADTNFLVQSTQVVDAIFTASQRRVYSCLFWFVVLGPSAAVFYRLIEQSRLLNSKDNQANALHIKANQLLAYLEWLPARLSVGAFMLVGHFEGAFSGYTKASNEGIEMDATNQQILSQSGRGGIQFTAIENAGQASHQVLKARGLVLRSLVVWLLFCLMISLL